ncbi:MAG TPA: MBL fold metallo-hydrolase [Thermoleophilaceae bacterium]|jgi:L-ascorbate metabolism protein UlaG (beta-lactamase superfamily)
MEIAYVGHSTVRLRAGGTTLLTDPVLRERILTLRRIAPPVALDEIRAPDAVLISHAHFDHLHAPSLRLLEPCPVVAPRGCAGVLRRAGFRDVTELTDGDSLRIGATTVTAIRVVHDGRRHPMSRAREALGYVVDAGTRAFFCGDTDLFDGMGELAGGLDVALLPIWGWGPKCGAGHMDPERAARATALMEPRVVVPLHWGTLASRNAPWLDDPERPAREFASRVAELAAGVEVRILAPGDVTEVGDAAGSGSEAE